MCFLNCPLDSTKAVVDDSYIRVYIEFSGCCNAGYYFDKHDQNIGIKICA